MRLSSTSFSLPPSLITRVEAVAAAEDRSRSSVVRRLLTAALAKAAPATFQETTIAGTAASTDRA